MTQELSFRGKTDVSRCDQAVRTAGKGAIIEMTKPIDKKRPSALQTKRRLKWLRDLYPIGQEVRHKTAKVTPRERGKICDEVAASKNVNRTIVDEARNLVDRYTKQDFDRLCTVRVNGLPLSRKHVFILARVQDLKRRRALEANLIREQLSVPQLYEEVRKRSGKQRKATGRRRRPRDVADALIHTTDLANQWLRWHEDLQRTEFPLRTQSIVWHKLRHKVASIENDLQALRDWAEKCLSNLPGRNRGK